MNNKIKVMDRKNSKLVADKVSSTLKQLGIELGVDFNINRIRYNGSGECKLSMVCVIQGKQSTEELDYNIERELLSLPPLGTKVEIRGIVFKITGWNHRAKKFPIKAERVDNGRAYKLSVSHVKSAKIIPEGRKRVRTKKPATK